MGAMLGDDQRLGFGRIEHLAGGMLGGHRLARGRATAAADGREMIDRGIGGLRAAQRLARVALLAAGPLA